MNAADAYPILFLAVIALYIAGAVLPLFFREARRAVLPAFVPAAVASSLTVALAASILLSGMVVRVSSPLVVPVPSIGFAFYIDGIAAFFMLIIGLVATAVSVYSLSYSGAYAGRHSVRSLGFLLNLFVLSMVLVTTTDN